MFSDDHGHKIETNSRKKGGKSYNTSKLNALLNNSWVNKEFSREINFKYIELNKNENIPNIVAHS